MRTLQPLQFSSCGHTIPRSSSPTTPTSPLTSALPPHPQISQHPKPTITHPANCLGCTIQHAKQTTFLTVSYYASLIRDANLEFESSPCFPSEIGGIVLQYKTDDFKVARNAEVKRTWEAVVETWNGASRASHRAVGDSEGVNYNGGEEGRGREVLRVWLECDNPIRITVGENSERVGRVVLNWRDRDGQGGGVEREEVRLDYLAAAGSGGFL